MTIRFVRPADSEAIRAIYGQYIHTPITFEYVLPTAEEFAHRVAEISAFYPYLVAEQDGAILGYAYAHTLRERMGFHWDVELSCYLAPEARAKGLGSALCRALMELLKAQGICTAYSCVAVPNPASEALHAALAFEECGLFRKTGYKNGAWHDTQWYCKSLRPYTVPAPEVIPVGELEPSFTKRVLEQALGE